MNLTEQVKAKPLYAAAVFFGLMLILFPADIAGAVGMQGYSLLANSVVYGEYRGYTIYVDTQTKSNPIWTCEPAEPNLPYVDGWWQNEYGVTTHIDEALEAWNNPPSPVDPPATTPPPVNDIPITDPNDQNIPPRVNEPIPTFPRGGIQVIGACIGMIGIIAFRKER